MVDLFAATVAQRAPGVHGLLLLMIHVGHLADSHLVSAPQVLGTNKRLAHIRMFMLYVYFCECFSSLL